MKDMLNSEVKEGDVVAFVSPPTKTLAVGEIIEFVEEEGKVRIQTTGLKFRIESIDVVRLQDKKVNVKTKKLIQSAIEKERAMVNAARERKKENDKKKAEQAKKQKKKPTVKATKRRASKTTAVKPRKTRTKK